LNELVSQILKTTMIFEQQIKDIMKKQMLHTLIAFLFMQISIAQNMISIDTTNFEINASSYVIEKYKGKNAIYLQGGTLTPKNMKFLNGTIEFDIYLKKEQAFPGVTFRMTKEQNAEVFYMRPHQSGNPDATQVLPLTRGVSPWQLYSGPRHSFVYNYKYGDWTHVKIIVNDNKAQIFLNYAKKPHLSWYLFHPTQEGAISFRGGNRSGMHIANIKINQEKTTLVNFKPIERKPIEGLIPKWEISDKFEEKLLTNVSQLKTVISARKWKKKILAEEGTAANISRQVSLRDKIPGNTVFAKITIASDKSQTKLFEFGYSDRVVVILNGKPLYRGNNNFRSRDYRYLGSIGLFDAAYLNLNKGKNELLLAVSENFGGWLVTGRFINSKGLKIR